METEQTHQENSNRREEFAHVASLPFLPSRTHMGKLDLWQSSNCSSAKILSDLVSCIIILVSHAQCNVIISTLKFSCPLPYQAFWSRKNPRDGKNMVINILSSSLLVIQRIFIKYGILILFTLLFLIFITYFIYIYNTCLYIITIYL